MARTRKPPPTGGIAATLLIAVAVGALLGAAIRPTAILRLFAVPEVISDFLFLLAECLAPFRHLAWTHSQPELTPPRWGRAHQAAVGALIPLNIALFWVRRERRWLEAALRSQLHTFGAVFGVETEAKPESEAQAAARRFLQEQGMDLDRSSVSTPHRRTNQSATLS